MPMNSCVIQAHPSGPPKANGPFTFSSLHPTALNTCGPILSKKIFGPPVLSCSPCPRLVPEGPYGTVSCNPCPASPHRTQPTAKTITPTGDRQALCGPLARRPFSSGSEFSSLGRSNGTVGQSGAQWRRKTSPHSHTSVTPAPNSAPASPSQPAASSSPSSGCRQAALSWPTASIFCSSRVGLAWPLCVPVPGQGRASAGPTGVSVAVGRQDPSSREGGRGEVTLQ